MLMYGKQTLSVTRPIWTESPKPASHSLLITGLGAAHPGCSWPLSLGSLSPGTWGMLLRCQVRSRGSPARPEVLSPAEGLLTLWMWSLSLCGEPGPPPL